MSNPIVASKNPVTLVGAGEIADQDLTEALSLAPQAVAADGGAAVLLNAGVMPKAVIGDLDSLDAETRGRIPVENLHQVREQDSTDFDKALRSVRAPLVLAVGFLGARLDHQLAVLNALVRLSGTPCIVIGPTEIVVPVNGTLSVDLDPGDVVSLFPMAPVRGRSQGLEWPIDGLLLSPDGRVGTSNRAKGTIVVEADNPGLLAILPRKALAPLTQQIVASSGA